jgi:hypothetical protein
VFAVERLRKARQAVRDAQKAKEDYAKEVEPLFKTATTAELHQMRNQIEGLEAEYKAALEEE